MPELDPRRLIQQTRELKAESEELCKRSRRAIQESKRLEKRLGLPHAKSGERRKHSVDITRNR